MPRDSLGATVTSRCENHTSSTLQASFSALDAVHAVSTDSSFELRVVLSFGSQPSRP
jgi:hypothetical protein